MRRDVLLLIGSTATTNWHLLKSSIIIWRIDLGGVDCFLVLSQQIQTATPVKSNHNQDDNSLTATLTIPCENPIEFPLLQMYMNANRLRISRELNTIPMRVCRNEISQFEIWLLFWRWWCCCCCRCCCWLEQTIHQCAFIARIKASRGVSRQINHFSITRSQCHLLAKFSCESCDLPSATNCYQISNNLTVKKVTAF